MSGLVAVVGMSGRFPGAPDVEAFWQNVRRGVESIARFSAEELAADGIDPALLDHPRFVNAGGALDGIDLFDAGLFGYNPREAEITDPQHRVFLECAWESLEAAGCDPFRHSGLIGVYAGTGPSTYHARLRDNPRVAALGGFQLSIGNEKDHLTTRVAYKLNLRGPAVTVQTTCSSSLVAVVLACQSLLTGQCDVALAGGVSIVVPQRTGYLYQEGGILSPDGHCRAFDTHAKGAVGGNGCGIVVLKRVADALASGDRVRAVISGAAINNDGSRKIGYTAPSVDGQAAVIARAHALADVDPAEIGYVEAHGTGTPLGDPIEVAALTQAFRAGTDRRGYCALGSVKPNVGHLDAAAGVTGLIKTVLAVERGELPPSLHYCEANPALDLASSPFYINSELRGWPAPRRAGVSSFGIGGTNAHVVVEQAPAPAPVTAGREHQLLVLAARSPEALDTLTANLARHLDEQRDLELADVAHTLQSGRVALAHRRVLVATERAAAAAALRGPLPIGVAAESSPPVAFLLPGQGVQHVHMAGRVYAAEPVFHAQLDRAAELLREPLGIDMRELVFPAEHDAARAAELLGRTAVAQPALFAVEYALARLWTEWGIKPHALLGHSVGEYVAACLSGAISFEDGLAIVAERGRLMQELPPGVMLAVPLSEAAVRPLLGDRLSLAAVNGPALCVVSGPEDAVRMLESALAGRGLQYSRLPTSHAFHSAAMDPIVEPFAEQVQAVAWHTPCIPWVSNVHGGWINASEATNPAYWGAQLRGTVRFADGLATLLENPDLILLEVGPGQTLTRMARSHPAAAGRAPIASLPHPTDRSGDDAEHIVAALGRLVLAGVTVDWGGFQGTARRRRVPLPPYPFERRRYWIDAEPRRQAPAPRLVEKTGTPDDWVWVPTWRRTAPRTPGPAGLGPWLIFDDGALGTELAGMLHARDEQVVRVSAGAGFARLSDREVKLDPGDRVGYGLLVEALRGAGLMPARIVHLWSLAGGVRPSFYSLLFLAQALIEARRADALELTAVSSGLYDVTGSEPLRPAAALLLGPCKVIPQEHPQIRCRSVDVAGAPDAAMLLAELTGEPSDPVVAHRGGHRWVQGFDQLAPPGTPPGLLRDDATYLVTGGLGAVGLALAEAIASAVRVNLVLVGRSAVPAPDRWESWVAAHGEDDKVSQGIRGIQRLERLGARVLAASADVADPEQLRAVVASARAQFGPIDGIVHAAGVTEAHAFGAVERTTSAACERHFAPKVDALEALDTVFADEQLDFQVLVSSLASLLGGLGFVAYAAANAYMDACAIARAREGKRWMSINWDGWNFSGAQVDGRLALTRDEGMWVFQRLMAAPPAAQVAVSTGDLDGRIAQWVRLAPVHAPAPARARAALHARPALDRDYEPPGDDVERFVAEVWQSLLGIDRIGLHDNFFDLGGNSLMALQAASRLRDAFRVDVSVHALFEAPTVAGLAAAISGAFAAGAPDDDLADVLDQVERLSDEEIAALLDDPGEPP